MKLEDLDSKKIDVNLALLSLAMENHALLNTAIQLITDLKVKVETIDRDKVIENIQVLYKEKLENAIEIVSRAAKS